MSARSVHEAAVEAMKRATCVCVTGIDGRHWNVCPAPAMPTAIAALVASAEVREGLREALHAAYHPYELGCLHELAVACRIRNDAEHDADAILAALGGGESAHAFTDESTGCGPSVSQVVTRTIEVCD